MKTQLYAFFLLLFALPFTANAAQQLIPAGSMIQCTISDPKLSSKTVAVGDPVLCQISHFELYGHSVFPYGTYLVGRFEAYKDPGHFVGKGWMDLKFDEMVIPPDGEESIDAKVVHVPGYPVDKEGRILGKGHAVRDTVGWAIPVLWPIDILNLPRRGPRPVLKNETRLTLKVMDDMEVPLKQPSSPNPNGFAQRAPMSYSQPAPAPAASTVSLHTGGPLTLLVLRDGRTTLASRYWFVGGTKVVYIAVNGSAFFFPIEQLDFTKTVKVNQQRGVNFVIRSAAY